MLYGRGGGHYALASSPGTALPLLMYWDSENTEWVLDESFSLVEESAAILGLHSDSDGGLYAVGFTGSVGVSRIRPLVLRYDSAWEQVFALPSDDFPTATSKFNGVVVTSDESDDYVFGVGVENSGTLFVESAQVP